MQFYREYTTIKSVEQRRQYKSDFNADYAEYRDLHAVVEKVSRRFVQLEERLKQEEESSQNYKVSLTTLHYFIHNYLEPRLNYPKIFRTILLF